MKNSPFNLPGTIVEIEIFADTIYYIIYGKYKIINKFRDLINEYSEKNNLDKKYITAKLNLPIARLCDNQQESHNQKSDIKSNFEFDDNLESIQCMVYADCNNKEAKDMYTILCLDKNKEKNIYELKYPFIELTDDFDPEEIIYKELKKISQPHAKYVRKNLKLVDIAGKQDEILVYSCKLLDSMLNKEIKIYKKDTK